MVLNEQASQMGGHSLLAAQERPALSDDDSEEMVRRSAPTVPLEDAVARELLEDDKSTPQGRAGSSTPVSASTFL